MASIVLLVSELLCGESASVLAANRYMSGQSLGEFRPAVSKDAQPRQNLKQKAGADLAGTRWEEKRTREEEPSFEDLAVSRIAVDVMWP